MWQAGWSDLCIYTVYIRTKELNSVGEGTNIILYTSLAGLDINELHSY